MRVVIPRGRDVPPNLFVVDAMIRQALQATAVALSGRQLAWNRLPHLFAHERADAEACKLFGTGTKGIAFATTVRTTLAENDIEGLKPGKGGGDETVLQMPLDDHFALRLIFDRSPQFFGHGFTLSLAFEVLTGPCAGCVWRDYPAFALLGRDGSTPVWIYASKLDLQEAVVGLSDFLRAMHSPLRAAFRAHVDPATPHLPPDIEDRTGWTARRAFEVASPLATAWNDRSRLQSIVCDDTLQMRSGAPQPVPVDAAGQLSANGTWRLTFGSPTSTDRFVFRVPAAGTVTSGVSAGGTNHAAFSEQLSIPEDWIDSDRAMNALAPFLGGEEVVRAATQTFMKLRVDHFGGQITGPRWGVRIYLDHGRERPPAALCDARTGLAAVPLVEGNW